LTADIAAAEFLSVTPNSLKPLFDGTPHSITLVRSALGPNASTGLEIVRIAELRTAQGPAVVRTRAALVPSARSKAFQFQPAGDPVVLLRAPYSLSVSYAGADRLWHPTWQQQVQLPKAVRLTVRNHVTNQLLPFSTTVLLHSAVPADCIDAKSFADCLLRLRPTTTSDKLLSEKQNG
jgi:general secretion pathway protein J